MGLPPLSTGDGSGSASTSTTSSRPSTTASWPAGAAFLGVQRIQDGGKMMTTDTLRSKLGMYGSFKPGTPAPVLGSRVVGSSGYIAYSSVDLLPSLAHGAPRDSGVLPVGWGLTEQDKQKLEERDEKNDAHHKEWLSKTKAALPPRLRAQRRRERDIQKAIEMVRSQRSAADDAYQTWAARKAEQEAAAYERQLKVFHRNLTLVHDFRKEDVQYQEFASAREHAFQIRTGPATLPRTFSDFNKAPPSTAPAGAARARTITQRTAPSTAHGTRPVAGSTRGAQRKASSAAAAPPPQDKDEGAEGTSAAGLPPIAPASGGATTSPPGPPGTDTHAAGAVPSSRYVPTSARPSTGSGSRGSRTPSRPGTAGVSPRTSGPPYIVPGSIHVPSKVPLVPIPDPIHLHSRPSSTNTSPIRGSEPNAFPPPVPAEAASTHRSSVSAGSSGGDALPTAASSPPASRGSSRRPASAVPRPMSARPGSSTSGRSSPTAVQAAGTPPLEPAAATTPEPNDFTLTTITPRMAGAPAADSGDGSRSLEGVKAAGSIATDELRRSGSGDAPSSGQEQAGGDTRISAAGAGGEPSLVSLIQPAPAEEQTGEATAEQPVEEAVEQEVQAEGAHVDDAGALQDEGQEDVMGQDGPAAGQQQEEEVVEEEAAQQDEGDAGAGEAEVEVDAPAPEPVVEESMDEDPNVVIVAAAFPADGDTA